MKMCHEKIHQNERPSQKKAQINFCIVSRVGNFRQKIIPRKTEQTKQFWFVPAEFRRNSGGIPAEFRLFRGTEISWNSVPNHSVEKKTLYSGTKIEADSWTSAEEKNARNSVRYNKNRSKLSGFRSESFSGRENDSEFRSVEPKIQANSPF